MLVAKANVLGYEKFFAKIYMFKIKTKWQMISVGGLFILQSKE